MEETYIITVMVEFDERIISKSKDKASITILEKYEKLYPDCHCEVIEAEQE